MAKIDFEYSATNELELMFQAVNYHNWIWQRIKSFCGNRVLEVGAGLGMFTEKLKNDRELVISSELDKNLLGFLRDQYGSSENVKVVEWDAGDQNNIESWWDPDTIACINVLEHIENDRQVLATFSKMLKSGNNLILFVPAFPALYGTIDRLGGHYRRYSKRDLIGKVKQAGFRIKKMEYFNSIGLICWFLVNRIFKLKGNNPSSVRFYDKFVVPILAFVEARFTIPFGQSLLVICER